MQQLSTLGRRFIFLSNLKPDLEALLASHEEEIACMHRCAVLQRDDLVMSVQPRVDLPLVGCADLRECCTLCRCSKADKQEAVTHTSSVTGKVGDHVTTGL